MFMSAYFMWLNAGSWRLAPPGAGALPKTDRRAAAAANDDILPRRAGV